LNRSLSPMKAIRYSFWFTVSANACRAFTLLKGG